MTEIKFITEPDETGLGRIIFDGKYYGVPAKAIDLMLNDLHGNRAAIAELVGALKLALDSHNLMLPADPPITAWKYRRVDEIGRAAITKHTTTTKETK